MIVSALAIVAQSPLMPKLILNGYGSHCTDCQKLSGTAFRVMVPCPESQFHLHKGEPKIYIKTAESGRRRQQAFCVNCGSPIYATSNELAGE